MVSGCYELLTESVITRTNPGVHSSKYGRQPTSGSSLPHVLWNRMGFKPHRKSSGNSMGRFPSPIEAVDENHQPRTFTARCLPKQLTSVIANTPKKWFPVGSVQFWVPFFGGVTDQADRTGILSWSAWPSKIQNQTIFTSPIGSSPVLAGQIPGDERDRVPCISSIDVTSGQSPSAFHHLIFHP